MCSNHFVLREDSLTFVVLDLHKYFQNFMEFIGIDITISSVFQADLESSIKFD
jgi:hypothetical protein